MISKRGSAEARAPAPPHLHSRGKSQCGSERVESLLEAAGVGPLGFGEGLEPLRDLLKAFFASCAGHSGIHVGVFVGLARNSRAEVIIGPADWLARCGIADLFEVLEMPVGVAGLALGSRAEYRRDVVVALDIGLLRKIQIAAIGLALASERRLKI